jgi:hypothetical protein
MAVGFVPGGIKTEQPRWIGEDLAMISDDVMCGELLGGER